MFQTVFYQILIMLIIMAVGVISYKTHIITDSGRVTLSNLLMMVVNPALVFMSFQVEGSSAVMQNILICMLLCAVIMTAMIVISTLVFRKNKDPNKNIELFMSAYGNCGFIGIPLVSGMLGSEGVVCLAGFVAVFNVFVWTHGYVTMSGSANRKQLLKGILSPTMFSIVIGMIWLLLDLPLPQLLYDSLDFISSMNTPLAMLIAGAALASADLVATFSNKRIYFVSFLKLIVFPALTMLILHFIPVNDIVYYSVLVASATPAATTGVAFALKFKKDYTYTSQIFVVSTLLSMATIPLVVFVSELIR